ncbi:MAG: tRNA pseudouridine(38-40) synthase TruA [Candidatus Omnitrophica bacterium]|nr:tRNA pseudouridine(38-40) synthase TruA [Candidatus Omnitrophota bacterium]
MRNIKLTISYDGTKFKGWQVQKNGRTVQEEIEKAIKRVFGKTSRIHGAGRTDSGVHAKGQVAHFKTSYDIPTRNIPPALNRVLPDSIVIIEAEEVSLNFHSRFDAKSKIYKYYIINTDHRDPFSAKYSWRVPYTLNMALMKREADVLEGEHDFKSFQASDKTERTSIREIRYVRVIKKNSKIIIEIKGNGFLYNMVRNIVGTLIDIGRGHLPPGSMKKILKAKDRTQAGPTAPAKGLFLMKIEY